MDQAGSSASGDAFHQLRIASRFIEMALYGDRFIYSGFTIPFYKCMLGKKLIMKDIESIDPEFYNSLVWIKENDIDDFRLELKKNEDKEQVTEENKEEYLTLMTDWRMTRSIDLQTQAFLDGFNKVVPIEWLQYFYERDKIGKYIPFIGITPETINKLHGFGSSSSSLTMKNEPVPMLQFVIGTCRVPVGGFAELMGSNEPHSICIEKVGK